MPSKKKSEKQARYELFEGQQAQAQVQRPAEQQLSIDQLVDKAERTHKDSTATAKRALRVRISSKLAFEHVQNQPLWCWSSRHTTPSSS
jgi:hypothetical protein